MSSIVYKMYPNQDSAQGLTGLSSLNLLSQINIIPQHICTPFHLQLHGSLNPPRAMHNSYGQQLLIIALRGSERTNLRGSER